MLPDQKNPSSNISIKPPTWESLFWINSWINIYIFYTTKAQISRSAKSLQVPLELRWLRTCPEKNYSQSYCYQRLLHTSCCNGGMPNVHFIWWTAAHIRKESCLLGIPDTTRQSCQNKSRVVSHQCQRSGSCAIPVGLKQREAEQTKGALLHSTTPFSVLRINPREAQGPIWSSEQTLMQQIGWCSFGSC